MVDRATNAEDLQLAERAYDAIVHAVEEKLGRWPCATSPKTTTIDLLPAG